LRFIERNVSIVFSLLPLPAVSDFFSPQFSWDQRQVNIEHFKILSSIAASWKGLIQKSLRVCFRWSLNGSIGLYMYLTDTKKLLNY